MGTYDREKSFYLLPSNSDSFPAAIPCAEDPLRSPGGSALDSPDFPSMSEKRFDFPSPTIFGRAVTGVVCNASAGREKRLCLRAVSSLRGLGGTLVVFGTILAADASLVPSSSLSSKMNEDPSKRVLN